MAGVVGAAFMLMRTDVRDSSRMLQRNMKTIRTWLEETQSSASTCVASARTTCISIHGKMLSVTVALAL